MIGITATYILAPKSEKDGDGEITVATVISSILILIAIYLVIATSVPLQLTYAASKHIAGDVSTSNLLKDYAVPISATIIAGVAASWNFIQFRWNGRYFQKLILQELGEISPETDTNLESPGELKSYMKKQFIHKMMLDNTTENKGFILTTNRNSIYHTKQLWSAFDNNDVITFIWQIYTISQAKKVFPPWWKKYENLPWWKKYEKKSYPIKKACAEWIKLITKNELRGNPDQIINQWNNISNKDRERFKDRFKNGARSGSPF